MTAPDTAAGSIASLGYKSLRIRSVVVPLRRPVIADIGTFDQWPLILVDLETKSGVIGSSYISPYRATAVPAIIEEIKDVASVIEKVGLSPFDVYTAGHKAVNVIGLTGVSLLARSALDMALWDARAKEAGLPLAVYLGGSIGPVRSYNSNGLWRHEVSTLAAEARDLLSEGGFTAVKLRLGNVHLKNDLAAIKAVRDGVGADVDVMVDFNQALGVGDAIRRCHDLDDQGLYWFEEPIAYDNVRGYAQLAKQVRTPLQMGENFFGDRDFFTFLETGGIDYAMVDLMRIGGITGWLRAAGVAAAAGVQFSNHLYPEIASHLLRVTPTAHWLEWVDWASPILEVPTQPKDGFITPSSEPGIGIKWNEAAISKYEVRH